MVPSMAAMFYIMYVARMGIKSWSKVNRFSTHLDVLMSL